MANPFGEHDGPAARLTVDADSLDCVFPLGLGPLATTTLAGALVTALLFLPSTGPLFALHYAAGLFLAPAGLVLLGRSLGRMSVDRSVQRACLATAARRRQAWIGAASAAIQVLAVLAVLWQGLEALGAGMMSGRSWRACCWPVSAALRRWRQRDPQRGHLLPVPEPQPAPQRGVMPATAVSARRSTIST
ncbi:MAG TPA: hypothetical protein VNS22_05560 [Geminicoccus sp.]|uniref:hypothetical protein n=1 Tax=Geminicoccus sp. TaxID=2024832 RepID=UPI002CA10CBA|nr:hypothetical protein [Geminicoccus sp.]HWL67834.1 hypothetical protein [Geminicoccus sp.]